jgi:Zn-dependent peptidase ImmA (M78 family)
LVPLRNLRAEYRDANDLQPEMERLARRFKVSSLVILRRMYDADKITLEEMRAEYQAELERIHAIKRPSGGDFYLTQGARLSKRFARAVVASTLEGQTLYRDAFRMLGFSKLATFHALGRSLGVSI